MAPFVTQDDLELRHCGDFQMEDVAEIQDGCQVCVEWYVELVGFPVLSHGVLGYGRVPIGSPDAPAYRTNPLHG